MSGPERETELRANELYWSSDMSVNQIAEELDLSKGMLYGLIRPRPAGLACPECSEELVYPNRTAKERAMLACPRCAWEGDEEDADMQGADGSRVPCPRSAEHEELGASWPVRPTAPGSYTFSAERFSAPPRAWRSSSGPGAADRAPTGTPTTMPNQRNEARDPRSIITPDAFEVSQALLGLPLATPWQRLWAILIDLTVIGLVTLLTKSFALVLGSRRRLLLHPGGLQTHPRAGQRLRPGHARFGGLPRPHHRHRHGHRLERRGNRRPLHRRPTSPWTRPTGPSR